MAVRPTLEGLEPRLLLYAVTGDRFAFGSRITWSIMPDGTNIGGVPSNFVSTMNQKFGNGAWQNALSDAFAQWERVANVNFWPVGDDGAALGSGSYQQGSPEYGDIRIGGYSQGWNALAFTLLPPGPNGGSDAGDMIFNTSQPWQINASFDLETVALHEIGHALGLGHSIDIGATMFPYYGGVDQSLDHDDVAGVQAIWGPRQEDPFVLNTGNTNSAHAADLTGFLNTDGPGQVGLPGLDVVGPAESYWFRITTPANASNLLTARAQSSTLSELGPRVQIYNANLVGLAQNSAPAGAYGAVVDATITNATPNTTYYVKVLAASAGDAGAGGYGLIINTSNSPTAILQPPNTSINSQPDQGGGIELMTLGGLGSWIKAWALSGETLRDFSSLGLTPNPHLTSILDAISGDLASFKDPVAAVDAALVALLQEIPAGLLDGTATGHGNGHNGSIPPGKIASILSHFFSDMESFLESTPGPGGP